MMLFSDLPPVLPDFLTTGQLAALLGVSSSTVRNWVEAGIIPAPARLTKKVHLFNTRLVRQALSRHVIHGRASRREESPRGEPAVVQAPPLPPAEGEDATVAC